MPRPANEQLPVTVAPESAGEWITRAATDGGGRLVPPAEAQALIWAGPGPDGLADVLAQGTNISWVQLPSAGIERYLELVDDRHTWTCAKEIYGGAVAEHALALALAGIHSLPQLLRQSTWRKQGCRDLLGGTVTIVGGGGIARALIDLLAPFQVQITVVRHSTGEMAGVERVLPSDRLDEGLAGADVVVLAAALTPETTGMIGAAQLERMQDDAWLVNVGRGKLVRTDDLVNALRAGTIGGAALDVTDPEPVPDGHPLWDLPNCIITPHCANPPEYERAQYAALIRDNIARRIRGEQLRGLVDPQRGY